MRIFGAVAVSDLLKGGQKTHPLASTMGVSLEDVNWVSVMQRVEAIERMIQSQQELQGMFLTMRSRMQSMEEKMKEHDAEQKGLPLRVQALEQVIQSELEGLDVPDYRRKSRFAILILVGASGGMLACAAAWMVSSVWAGVMVPEVPVPVPA